MDMLKTLKKTTDVDRDFVFATFLGKEKPREKDMIRLLVEEVAYRDLLTLQDHYLDAKCTDDMYYITGEALQYKESMIDDYICPDCHSPLVPEIECGDATGYNTISDTHCKNNCI